MRRLFWLSVGAGAGVYVSHRVKRRVVRFTRSWSPDGVAARAVAGGQGAGERLRHFVSDVRTEMHAREEELREAVRTDQAPPDAAPSRVLRARYTIINDIDDDKDGH
ncbi:hypothetical protein GCM10022254_68980 [Actinomadura meridiana]|uniref:Secreted protein n=1 Tax=Actinomadura meridiana TaxID=559626 RepID=A0ABP8CMX4_9ACTN